jgi:hypothetical protein
VGKVRESGFEPIFVTSFVSLLMPFMALDRLRPRREADYDFRREFRRSRLIDQTLEAVLTAERRLIRRGVSLPFGGSLLLAATARTL